MSVTSRTLCSGQVSPDWMARPTWRRWNVVYVKSRQVSMRPCAPRPDAFGQKGLESHDYLEKNVGLTGLRERQWRKTVRLGNDNECSGNCHFMMSKMNNSQYFNSKRNSLYILAENNKVKSEAGWERRRIASVKSGHHSIELGRDWQECAKSLAREQVGDQEAWWDRFLAVSKSNQVTLN